MPREFSRASRVAEQIRRELAELIAREVNDPRIRTATVSRVEVTRDLTQAKVFITPDGDSEVGTVLRAFVKAGGFLRHGLATRLRARSVPRLLFSHDKALDEAAYLARLIESTAPVTNGETPEMPSSRDSAKLRRH